MILAFVVLTQYQRVTDRQTDRETDNPTIANTGLFIASYADSLVNKSLDFKRPLMSVFCRDNDDINSFS